MTISKKGSDTVQYTRRKSKLCLGRHLLECLSHAKVAEYILCTGKN